MESARLLVFGAARRRASVERQRASLEEVIEGLAGDVSAGEERVAMVLDEFQAIRRFGGEPAEWHLRDLVQRFGELAFVCAGSGVSLIHEMLGRDRAFYRTFELLHMGPIERAHPARWIDSRLAAEGLEPPGTGEGITFDSSFTRLWVEREALPDVPPAP